MYTLGPLCSERLMCGRASGVVSVLVSESVSASEPVAVVAVMVVYDTRVVEEVEGEVEWSSSRKRRRANTGQCLGFDR